MTVWLLILFAFIFFLIAGIRLYKKRMLRETRDLFWTYLQGKDAKKIYDLLIKRRNYARKLLKKEPSLVNEGLDLLFFKGEFDSFLKVLEELRIDDQRRNFLYRDTDVLAVDIETEIVMETMPREIGLVGVRSRDWGIAAILKIKDFASFENKYGVTPQYFFKRMLEKDFKAIVGHNILEFDTKILREWGIELPKGKIIDTYFLSVVAIPEAPSHALEYLSRMFGIKYTPHEAQEDALASVLLLTYLVSIASNKGILEEIIELHLEPLNGLGSISILRREIPPPPCLRLAKPRTVHVTIDAQDAEDAWYPYRVNLQKLESLVTNSVYDSFAKIVVKSFVKAGKGDPLKIVKLKIAEEYSEALMNVTSATIEPNYPSIEHGFTVEYKYLGELLRILGSSSLSGEEIVFNGAYLLDLFFPGGIEKAVEWASRNFNTVALRSLFQLQISAYKENVRHEQVRSKPILIVEEGLDKSSRHLNFIARLVASIARESRRIVVLTSTRPEELALQSLWISTGFKLTSVEYKEPESAEILLRLYDYAKTGFQTVVMSTTLMVKRHGADKVFRFLKLISEAFAFSSNRILIVNSDSSIFQRLFEIIEKTSVKPSPDVDVRITPFVFDSVGSAINEVEEVVKEIWGFNLRPYQRKCVARLLLPYSREGLGLTRPLTIVILPTGSGKSLIFQSVAKSLKRKVGGTTVVISPLLALIEDQVNSLKKRGLNVCAITSMAGKALYSYISGLARGKYDIVYITPEQFEKEEVRKSFEKVDINYLILDEIHTLSKWGKTFRPSYSYLANYLKSKREEGYWIPVAGFTATLPQEELETAVEMITGDKIFDLEEIGFHSDYEETSRDLLSEKKVLRGPVLRENISIDISATFENRHRLEDLLETVKDLSSWADNISRGKTWVGIIYTGFVKSKVEHENTGYIASYLSKSLGEKVLYFHGQMSDTEKKNVLELLYNVACGKTAQPRIVVATKAFGMGVDLPNIRWVIHYMMSESIEDYYQEIGRGGRDGQDCKAVMLYSEKDFSRRLMLLRRSFIKPRFVVQVYNRLRLVDEGASIPLALLLPALGYRPGFSKALRELTRRRIIREEERNALERSLSILSEIGVLDYDMTRESFILSKVPLNLPKYRLEAGGQNLYLISERSLNGSQRRGDGFLYMDEEGRVYLTAEPINEGFPLTNGKLDTIRVNYVSSSLQPIEIYKAVSKVQTIALMALSLMEEYSKRLLQTSGESTRELAKKLISEYLATPIEKIYWRIVEERRKHIERICPYCVEIVRDLIISEHVNLRNYKISQHGKRSRSMGTVAGLLTLYMLEKRVFPGEMAIIIPYGLKSHFEKAFREFMGLLNIVAHNYLVISITREKLLNINRIAKEVEGIPVVAIVIASYRTLMMNLAREISSSGTKVLVIEI